MGNNKKLNMLHLLHFYLFRSLLLHSTAGQLGSGPSWLGSGVASAGLEGEGRVSRERKRGGEEEKVEAA